MKYCVEFLIVLCILSHQGFAQDTVQVYGGWNIIGSLGSGISPAELMTMPPGIITSGLFEYTPGAGYEEALTLEKGRGYWVKVNSDGIIIFNPPPPPPTLGTANVSWTLINSEISPGVDTPADCSIDGNMQVIISGPTNTQVSGPCSDWSLVVSDLAGGTYTFDLILTDPANHPGQSATAQVMADIIEGSTADIEVTIDCTFCNAL